MKLRKCLAFFVRDFLWDLSYPLNFAWRFASIMFTLITFYFLGRLLASGASPHLAAYGGEYFPFVMVGLALASFQGVALTSISYTISYGMYTGTLEAMLVTPTSLSTIIFSSVLYQFTTALLEIGIYILFSAAFFGMVLGRADLPAAGLLLLLTLLAHLPLGILSAGFLLLFKRGDPITALLGHLSGLVAGVYFPIQVLPGWLQSVAQLLPFTHALEGLRQAVLNGKGVTDLSFQIAVLGLFALALTPLSLAVFAWTVRQAKRLGTLSQF
ncbi:MAG: ABC transporter permease [Deltaproteobacteria bacterium]|nr:ABC transporter permease [Deltaproteobacteria bacterium]